MSLAAAHHSFVPERLAASPEGVLRRRVPSSVATDTLARLTRTKERLYVVCQVGGWGTFTLAYLALGTLGRSLSLADACLMAAGNALGLLVSHLYRSAMRAYRWTELGWAALIPRALVASTVAALLWTAASWPLYLFLSTSPRPPDLTLGTLFVYSAFNGFCIFSLWSALYFVYHAVERLRRLQVEQFQLIASAKEAELRALKSQVNPHFLFNSLNSLRALIDEDAPRAREAVTRLANMLRYSLQSGQLELVPLEDEVRIVEDYLALEQIRHEDRLRVRWEVADEARGLAVPPMLLQTLVENAVKYGISPRRGGGEIAIAAALEDRRLVVRVTNPGDLAPPHGAAAKAGSSTGVGLRNASERLQLLFGDRARLSLRASDAGLVTAEVVIPLPTSP